MKLKLKGEVELMQKELNKVSEALDEINSNE